MKIARLAAPLVLISQTALAHPDHGTGTSSMGHLLTDPFHLLLAGVAIGLAFGARRLLRATAARVRR